MKVYIIGYSDYEGFDIRAVVADREQAERIKSEYGEDEILEYETDTEIGRFFQGTKKRYCVTHRIENGEASFRARLHPVAEPPPYGQEAMNKETPWGRYWLRYLWADNQEDAIEQLRHLIEADK